MMAERKLLSKRQRAVIEDIFNDQLDEQSVLDKHKVSRHIYNRWLANESFGDEFNSRIASAHLQSELIIAKYAPLAAAKLVQLTESENQETARKACLDIISVPTLSAKRAEQSSESKTQDIQPAIQLSEATASRLLTALAEEKGEKINQEDNLNVQ